jgi:hypothetical protein
VATVQHNKTTARNIHTCSLEAEQEICSENALADSKHMHEKLIHTFHSAEIFIPFIYNLFNDIVRNSDYTEANSRKRNK